MHYQHDFMHSKALFGVNLLFIMLKSRHSKTSTKTWIQKCRLLLSSLRYSGHKETQGRS